MLLAAGLLFAVLGSAGSTGSTGAGYIATLSGGGGGAGGGWENGAFADGAGDKEVRNALVNKMPQIETMRMIAKHKSYMSNVEMCTGDGDKFGNQMACIRYAC